MQGTAAMRPVMCVVGARPNFMKMAPILRALAAHSPPIPALLLHTGQHYDQAMSDQLFKDLGLPRPDINLEVGSGSHAVQTAEVMKRFEPALDEHEPACVLVVGDVNSTLACALVAVKKGVPVVHVEAGLRSGDRRMPEEINRLLTDQISDRLYTTERTALANLQREGIAEARVCFAGNVMIDSLLASRPAARSVKDTLALHGISPAIVETGAGYAVVTMHRPSNVDDPTVLRALLGSPMPLTIDVEDYFQVSALAPYDRAVGLGRAPNAGSSATSTASWRCWQSGRRAPPSSRWAGWPSGIPALVRRIVAAGHELASHGYGHERASDLTAGRFPATTSAAPRPPGGHRRRARSRATGRPASRSAPATCGPSTACCAPATATAPASTRSRTTTTACRTRRASAARGAPGPARVPITTLRWATATFRPVAAAISGCCPMRCRAGC
jgi:hypothetical protein